MRKITLLALFLLSFGATAADYQVQLLQSLSGTGNSLAYGLNDNGMVVGQSFNSTTGKNEAVVWTNGIVVSIGTEGIARAVNNSGVVVGETGGASLFLPSGKAFQYSNGTYTEIGDLGGSYSGAYDINDSGTITGFSCTNYTVTCVLQSQGFRYENGTMESLGTVSSPTGYSRGHGINEDGTIVGRSSLVDFTNSDKFLAVWDEANAITSITGPYTYSTGQQINSSGVIVGNGYNASTQMRGMLWNPNGTLAITMGTFGGTESRAWSINDIGTIVGFATNASNAKRAMVSFDGGNTLIDLNTLVDLSGFLSLDEAFDINEAGDIVGVGTLLSGQKGAFIVSATAVPVPAAVWLFGSGLLAMAGIRRKARPSIL